jgi:hypothetical protein
VPGNQRANPKLRSRSARSKSRRHLYTGGDSRAGDHRGGDRTGASPVGRTTSTGHHNVPSRSLKSRMTSLATARRQGAQNTRVVDVEDRCRSFHRILISAIQSSCGHKTSKASTPKSQVQACSGNGNKLSLAPYTGVHSTSFSRLFRQRSADGKGSHSLLQRESLSTVRMLLGYWTGSIDGSFFLIIEDTRLLE